jgi:hypothetical protein
LYIYFVVWGVGLCVGWTDMSSDMRGFLDRRVCINYDDLVYSLNSLFTWRARTQTDAEFTEVLAISLFVVQSPL